MTTTTTTNRNTITTSASNNSTADIAPVVSAQLPLPTVPVVVPCIFFLLGIGVLVPWNTFISLNNYYENRFCSEETTSTTTTLTTIASSRQVTVVSNGSTDKSTNMNIESTFSTVYNVSSILTIILLISVRLVRDQWRILLLWCDYCRRYYCCGWMVVAELPPRPYYSYNAIIHTDSNNDTTTGTDIHGIHGNNNGDPSHMANGVLQTSDEYENNIDDCIHQKHTQIDMDASFGEME